MGWPPSSTWSPAPAAASAGVDDGLDGGLGEVGGALVELHGGVGDVALRTDLALGARVERAGHARHVGQRVHGLGDQPVMRGLWPGRDRAVGPEHDLGAVAGLAREAGGEEVPGLLGLRVAAARACPGSCSRRCPTRRSTTRPRPR